MTEYKKGHYIILIFRKVNIINPNLNTESDKSLIITITYRNGSKVKGSTITFIMGNCIYLY